MHADDGCCLHTLAAQYRLEVNHRNSGVRIALGACLNTSIAANATAGVDVEVTIAHDVFELFCQKPRLAAPHA
jgi:hypothetical protein